MGNGLRQEWKKPLMTRVLNRKSLELCSRTLNGTIFIAEPDYNLHAMPSYNNLSDIVTAFQLRDPIKCVYDGINHYITLRSVKKMVRVDRVRFSSTLANCHYHFFDIDIANMYDIGTKIPVGGWVECLMLPKLDMNGKAERKTEAEYTVIYDNWKVMGINGEITLS